MTFNYKKILLVLTLILSATILLCGCGKDENENIMRARTGNPEAYFVKTDAYNEPNVTDAPKSVETAVPPDAEPQDKNNNAANKIDIDSKAVSENVTDENIDSNSYTETETIPTPVPEIKIETEDNSYVIISIDCSTILNNMDKLAKNKQPLVPPDGIILPPSNVRVYGGESAFDILKTITQEHKIHMEFSTSAAYKTAYIEGIGNLYEFDCGNLSGWTYRINDEFFSHGASAHEVHAGDVIEFLYTCDLGKDVGANGSWE